MKTMPEMPRMKEICPKCGKKVHHLRKHLRRNHSSENLETVATPETTETAQETVVLERNPELDTLSQKVAAEEAKFGISPNPIPNAEKKENSAANSDSEEESPSVSQSDTIFDPEATNYIISTIFNTMANLTKEEDWALDKEEMEILGPPLNRVVNKHAPNFLKKYQDEVVLGTVLASIFITKVQRINAKKTVPPGGNKNEQRRDEQPQQRIAAPSGRKPAATGDDLSKFKADP